MHRTRAGINLTESVNVFISGVMLLNMCKRVLLIGETAKSKAMEQVFIQSLAEDWTNSETIPSSALYRKRPFPVLGYHTTWRGSLPFLITGHFYFESAKFEYFFLKKSSLSFWEAIRKGPYAYKKQCIQTSRIILHCFHSYICVGKNVII